MRKFIGLLGVLVISLLIVAPAQAARSGAKAIWGPVSVDGVSQFPMYHDLGVGIYEDALSWATVAPTRPSSARDPRDPAYQWPAEIDDAVAQARRYHMRVMLQLFGAPGWANGGRARNYAPRSPGDFAAFAVAAARRYPGVHLWMVWGEPSRVHNFAPLTPARPGRRLTTRQKAAPHRYARLLDSTYAALKQVSSRNRIIGGNTYTTGDISTRQWIENLRLPNGHRPRMDFYGHNPFSFRRPNLHNPPSPRDQVDFSDLGRLARLVNRELAPRGRHLRLFLSEWTIPTGPDGEFNFHVTRALQASWIRDAWRIVRRTPSIYALGWIHFYDDPPGPGSSGGLLDYRGVPKPGYKAFGNG